MNITTREAIATLTDRPGARPAGPLIDIAGIEVTDAKRAEADALHMAAADELEAEAETFRDLHGERWTLRLAVVPLWERAS